MRISKWHGEPRNDNHARRRDRRGRYERDTVVHWMPIDGATYERLAALAVKHRTTPARLFDKVINALIDREEAA